MKITLDDLAKKLNARLYGNGDIIITGVASINKAQTGDITFLKDHHFRNKLHDCSASAVVLSEDNLAFCRSAALIVQDPYLTYVKIAQLMDRTPDPAYEISSNAIISMNVVFGKKVKVGSNATVESGVILGDEVIIGPGSFIGKNVKIGTGTHLWANVIIYHEVEIGEHCLIQSGAVIGSDGFGYINRNQTWIKIPQLGIVKIGNNVEIGACTTIDRGSLDDTIIKNGVIIDNQCQIAHNVTINQGTAIAGGVIVAGSSVIGQYCMIGGASVINGHINLCDKVTITGMSMVMKSITNPGVYSSGIPVQPNIAWRKTAVSVMHITKINKRIKVIEKRLIKYCTYCIRIKKIIYFFIFLWLIGFISLVYFFLIKIGINFDY